MTIYNHDETKSFGSDTFIMIKSVLFIVRRLELMHIHVSGLEVRYIPCPRVFEKIQYESSAGSNFNH